jgi:hypothetical protein
MPLKLRPTGQSAAFTIRLSLRLVRLSLRLDGRAIPMDSRTDRLQGTLTKTLGIALADLRQHDDALGQRRPDGIVTARSGAERGQCHNAPAGPSVTIRQIEFELEKAEHGMGMLYDAERVGQLRKMLVEARKRKLSDGLARRRRDRNRRDVLNGPYDAPDRPRLRGR